MHKATSSGDDDKKESERESSDEEEDFMSDAFLAKIEASSKTKDNVETYSEKRRRQINESKDRGKIVNRAQREAEARKAGLSRHLFGEIEEDHKDSFTKRKRVDEIGEVSSVTTPSTSLSSNKALKMMMAMGYQQGQALGKRNDDDDDNENDEDGQRATAIVEPLDIDERWLGSKARAGIGRMSAQSAQALSRDISKASERERESKTRMSAEEQYRLRSREEHSIRHWERLLVDARKTCEDLDTVLGVKFSPLWLNPESLTKQSDQLPEHVAQLIEYAFEGMEGEPVQDEEAIARAKEAKQFCLLPAKARLDITLSHLRRAHNYCLFCGHQYGSLQELTKSCPGEEEDDH